jgi:hypothetical protein
VRVFLYPNNEVVGLDVPVQEVPTMDVIKPFDHLVRQHEDRFYTEVLLTELEQVLQARPQQIHDHDVVVPFREVIMDPWQASEYELLVLGLGSVITLLKYW